MRIGDWSSDVCSSDLGRDAELAFEHGCERARAGVAERQRHIEHALALRESFECREQPRLLSPLAETHAGLACEQTLDGFRVDMQRLCPLRGGRIVVWRSGNAIADLAQTSAEERREGKGCVSTCKHRGW